MFPFNIRLNLAFYEKSKLRIILTEQYIQNNSEFLMTNNQHTDNNPTELDKGNTEIWFFENTKSERIPYDM